MLSKRYQVQDEETSFAHPCRSQRPLDIKFCVNASWDWKTAKYLLELSKNGKGDRVGFIELK